MSITYSGQDSETTIVLNTAPNTYTTTRKTIAPDQMKSEQLVHEIKTDAQCEQRPRYECNVQLTNVLVVYYIIIPPSNIRRLNI